VTDLLTSVRTHPVLGRILRFRPIAILGALLLVFGTAAATREPPTGSIIYGRVKAQDVRLSMPATNHPKGMAIFFHGQNGGVDSRMDDPWLQSLVRAGWVVAASDFHTDSWGNEKSTEDTEDLLAWAAQETHGLPVRLYVSGSMGATVSLNAMTHGVAAPPCWYGVKPAVDLTKMHNVPGADRIIEEAFGGPVPYDRNPVNTINELSTTTRYRMVTSPEDTWVKEKQNTDALATGLEARGAQVSILQVHGTHDDPSHFDNEDLLSFASSCLPGAEDPDPETATAAHTTN
jgi:dienelactone hydrolase